MTAPAAGVLPRPADVLASAADQLESTYPAARLTSVALIGAIRQAAAQLLPGDEAAAYQLRCDAADLLAGHLHVTGGDERMLTSWSRPYPRVEVCAILRAAAKQALVVARG